MASRWEARLRRRSSCLRLAGQRCPVNLLLVGFPSCPCHVGRVMSTNGLSCRPSCQLVRVDAPVRSTVAVTRIQAEEGSCPYPVVLGNGRRLLPRGSRAVQGEPVSSPAADRLRSTRDGERVRCANMGPPSLSAFALTACPGHHPRNLQNMSRRGGVRLVPLSALSARANLTTFGGFARKRSRGLRPQRDRARSAQGPKRDALIATPLQDRDVQTARISSKVAGWTELDGRVGRTRGDGRRQRVFPAHAHRSPLLSFQGPQGSAPGSDRQGSGDVSAMCLEPATDE